ncbi:MAG: ABC transporter substrate-binding protein [Ilumatobacter sp.]
MRIASLIPSATEIVFALGMEDQLCGVTFECDYPPDPRTTRAVVVGGLDTHGLEPIEIDQLVRAKIAAGEDLYRLDDDRFRECNPTHVLTQDLCRVCALPSEEADAALDRLGCDAVVTTLDPHTLDDVFTTIIDTGRSLGVVDRADDVVEALRSRLASVAHRVAGRSAPSVFMLEWSDPPFLSGHWVPELASAAGATPVLAEAGGRSVPTQWDTITEHDPDIVIVAPCGFGLEGATEQAESVLERLPPRAQVWAIDADGLVVRPGPRLVDGVEALATIFHPDVFDSKPHPAVKRVR